MSLYEYFCSGFRCAMQEQFGAPRKEISFAGLHFGRALIFANSLEWTALAFCNVPERGVKLSTVLASFGSRSGGEVIRCSVQRDRFFRQRFFGVHNHVRPVSAKI